jgi:preprotein translocase subunit SecA
VMNKQREVIYGERNAILDGKDIHGRVETMLESTITEGVAMFCPERTYAEEWDWDGLESWLTELTGSDLGAKGMREGAENPHTLAIELGEKVLERYNAKEAELGPDNLRELERQVMLRVIDTRWMDHLLEMDYLQEGIGLRAMGQRDPLVEYKQEAYDMFGGLVAQIEEDFLRTILHIQLVLEPARVPTPMEAMRYTAPSEQSIFAGAAAAAAATGVSGPSPEAIAQASAAVGGGGGVATLVKDKTDPYATCGRNDPCPCGSGKKFKKCHGAAAN